MNNLYKLRVFNLTLVLFCTILASILVQQLPISLYPNSTKPTVRVTVKYTMDVVTFKDTVGKKLEQSIRNIDSVDKLDVRYRANRSDFYVSFKWKTNPDQALKDVATVASFYQAELPENYPPIKTSYYDAGLELYVAANSEVMDLEKFGKVMKSRLIPALETIPGLASSYVTEVNEKEIAIIINPYSLVTYNLTLEDILSVLHKERFDTRLGTIRSNERAPEYQVMYVKSPKSIKDLEQIVVLKTSERLVQLSEVAKITLRPKEDDRFYYIDEKQSIAIGAGPMPGTNLYTAASRFEQTLDKYVADLGELFVLNSPMTYIKVSLKQMALAVLTGMLFTALCVLIAFRTLRITLLIACTMPMSIIFGICMLSVFDVGINLVSIGAVGVTSGMVIDNSVFVLQRIRQELVSADNADNSSIQRAVKSSVRSVLSTTATSLVVFLPLIFTQPVVKALVGELVVVIILLLLASIFVSLVVLPTIIMLLSNSNSQYRYLVKTYTAHTNKNNLYTRVLNVLLSSKLLSLFVLAIISIAFAYSIHLLSHKVKKDVVAQPLPNIIDVGLYFSDTELPAEKRKALVFSVRDVIKTHLEQEIKFIYTDLRKNLSYLSIHIKDYTKASDIIEELRQRVKDTPDYSVDISPWVSASIKVENIPHLELRLSKTNHNQDIRLLDKLYRKLKTSEGIYKVKVYPKTRLTQFAEIDVDEVLVSKLAAQTSVDELEQQIINHAKYSLDYEYLYDVNLADGPTPLAVKLGKERIDDLAQLTNQPVRMGKDIVNLGHIAQVNLREQSSNYFSRNGEQSYLIEIWFNRDIKSHRAHLKSLLTNEIQQYPDRISILNTDKETEKNVGSLKKALYCSLALILLVLLFDFSKLVTALIAMSCIPLGFIGAAISLYQFDSTLSVNSLIGLMMLGGLGINNAIFIIHGFTENLLNSPNSTAKDNIIRAANSRLMPISVTTVSTICGMLPLAMGLGNGGPIMQPLGLALAGGMLSVFVLSLFLIPVLLHLTRR